MKRVENIVGNVFYNNGKDIHREDGPAIIWSNGDKEWWLNGKRYDPMEWLLKLHEIKGK